MNDPALGQTKAERSGVVPTPRNGNRNFRKVNYGQFSGPRQSYGRYNVAENATDAINPSLRSKGR